MSETQTGTNLPAQQQQQKSPTLKNWLDSPEFKASVAKSLPKHLTPDRFVRMALTAMMRTPKLNQCTQASLFKCLLDLSSIGLEPDGRRAHLIPYENRKTGAIEAQLIIDYKGIIELAKRSGEVATIRAELVCENDEFSWENGVVRHAIDWRKDRGKVQCVYSHVRNKNGVDEYEVMTLAEVDAIRKRSKAKDSGPWVTDFNEMAKKTVVRRHSKKLTLSPEYSDALEKDDDRLDDLPTASYTMGELMPKRLSEMAGQPELGTDAKPEDAPSNGQGLPTIDPEAKIGHKSLARLIDAVAATGGAVTNQMLTSYVKDNLKVGILTDLKNGQVEDVLNWINFASQKDEENEAGAQG